MPFLNQCRKYNQTLNSTQQYDDTTHNMMRGKGMVQNGEKKGKKTVLWNLHQNWVSCNVEFCMETAQCKLYHSITTSTSTT